MSDTISILDGFPIGQKFSQALVKLSPLSCGEHHPAMGSRIIYPTCSLRGSQLLSANNCDPRRERFGSVAREVRGSGKAVGLDAGEVGVERRSDRDVFMAGLESIFNILPELFGSR